jgi:hypothetical protein
MSAHAAQHVPTQVPAEESPPRKVKRSRRADLPLSQGPTGAAAGTHDARRSAQKRCGSIVTRHTSHAPEAEARVRGMLGGHFRSVRSVMAVMMKARFRFKMRTQRTNGRHSSHDLVL